MHCILTRVQKGTQNYPVLALYSLHQYLQHLVKFLPKQYDAAAPKQNCICLKPESSVLSIVKTSSVSNTFYMKLKTNDVYRSRHVEVKFKPQSGRRQ